MDYTGIKVTPEVLEHLFQLKRESRDHCREMIGNILWQAFKLSMHMVIIRQREKSGRGGIKEGTLEKADETLVLISEAISSAMKMSSKAVWEVSSFLPDDLGEEAKFLDAAMGQLFIETDEILRERLAKVFTTENLQLLALTKGKKPEGLKKMVDALFRDLTVQDIPRKRR